MQNLDEYLYRQTSAGREEWEKEREEILKQMSDEHDAEMEEADNTWHIRWITK